MKINRVIYSHNPKGRTLLYIHIIMFLLAFVLIISRRPDAILNPQFWAEDGSVFYAHAYNNGIVNSLLLPYAGYLHAVPRLTAAFSMLFSLKLAPLIFNLVAIIIQILPVNFLISSRFSKLIPNINYRISISFLYLVLPGCYEINANITNAQWHLALLIFMAIIVQSSRFLVNLFDILLIFIGGLTGPFSIIIIPIIPFLICSKKLLNKNALSNTLLYTKIFVIIVTAIIQIFVITTDKIGQKRTSGIISGFLSFNIVPTISNILTNQLFLPSILGTKITDQITYNLFKTLPESVYMLLITTVVIIGIITLAYLLVKSPVALKLFIIFAALIPITAIVLRFPNITTFVSVGSGGRYWFNLILALALGIVWISYQIYKEKNHILNKLVVTIILLIMSVGIISDWRHPAYIDFKFAKYVDTFTELPSGNKMIIPINPMSWSMELIKH